MPPRPPARLDPLDSDAVAGQGDRVVYALESRVGERRQTWTLELSLPAAPAARPQYASDGPDPASGFMRARDAIWGTLSDAQTGAHLVRYSTDGDLEILLRGRDGTVIAADRVATQLQVHVWQQTVTTCPDFGLQFLFLSLLRSRGLLLELADVIQTPSIASFVANGMKAYVAIEFDTDAITAASEIDSPLGRLPTFWLPGRLLANDQIALVFRLQLTWRRSPLLPSLGILRLEGRHPTDTARTVALWLIGAERGAPDQPVDRRDLGPSGLRIGMSEAQLLAHTGSAVERRYRLRLPDGTVADVLCLAGGDAAGRAAAIVRGEVVFFGWPGVVGRHLEYRGAPRGIYRPEFLVQ